ncbi:MAG: hypothetical protein DRN95_03135 [Candidatus Hydrothermarchaeota archaeon]|nr:MAG: hypothetical protein DRN95_03135 [Candidatus Hydrothermarchaeota archaeon]
MVELEFEKIKGESKEFFATAFGLLILVLWGLYGFLYTYTKGPWVTGMTNQIPWGLPQVTIVYLIGASAGSLIISALGGVFDKEEYKVFSRLAAYLAALMIIGALLVIFVDLGKPEHAFNLFFHFNFRSIFAWNAFLYSSYLLIIVVYLIAQFERKETLVKVLAFLAVAWAVLVHSGTGGIVGFIYSMELWHSPLTPPLFIISAIASGIGIMIPLLVITFKYTNRELDINLVKGLAKIMGAMIITLLYCFTVEHLTRGYVPGNSEALHMTLFEAPFGTVFWFIQIFVGMIIPLALLIYPKTFNSVKWICVASILLAIGVFAERYTLIVPGLSYSKEILPGMVVESVPPFVKGASYVPGWTEVAMVVGVFALIFLLFMVGLKIFDLLPKIEEVEEVAE